MKKTVAVLMILDALVIVGCTVAFIVLKNPLYLIGTGVCLADLISGYIISCQWLKKYEIQIRRKQEEEEKEDAEYQEENV